ncbi:MAG: chromosomal replication initiator protein DnaA [Proteobacteria bacterium]|nr:chromosomal replication initiator protein DnaA [Pseudomonadota bacterium]NIS70679.1 chromosomal replication initiator protein DnaA [Pseudomonadota bacterium]
MNPMWQKVLQSLREKVNPQSFETWIKPIKPLSIDNNEIQIQVPNRFFQDWIQDNYLSLIQTCLLEECEQHLTVSFVINPPTEHVPSPGAQSNQPITASSTLWKSPFNPKYTFDSFVVGPSNQFANAACLAVANLPGKNYNPLFIYGGVGLGKTHLLHAIGSHVLQKSIIPDSSSVSYLSSEDFTNELINSIRYERMDEFRNRFRRINILLIDDIQFIAGKERTQAEFFHIFNSLYENRKQIVVTSDKFPRDIPNLEERLSSRFEWGLVADIQAPDVETKVAILKKKAFAERINLPNDVAFFLATNIDSNIRILEGSLTRIGAFASLTNIEITLEMAKEVLKNMVREENQTIPVEAIQKTVASFFNIRFADLKAKKKNKSFVLPRQVAMYLSRKLTGLSLQEIGEKFGGKDHTTVLHAIKKIEQKSVEDPALKENLGKLTRNIRNQ